MRVRANAGVGIRLDDATDLIRHDATSEVLEVHLVNDAGAGRHHLEVVKGCLSPTQELVTLTVALVLKSSVALKSVSTAKDVDDDRVVDNEFRGRQRIDDGGVAAKFTNRLPHCREVDHARHTGEVLHDDPGWGELNLRLGLGLGVPRGERPDVIGGDVLAVLGAQQRFCEDLERVRELLQPRNGIQAIDLVGLVANSEGGLGSQGVDAHRAP